MAGTIERILAIKFIGNTKPLDKSVSKTRKGLSKLGQVAAGVAVGGLIGISYAAIEGVKAFRQEQDIIRAFNRTVTNLHLPVRTATAAMEDMADRAMNLGFDDAEAIGGMSKFLQLTGDVGKSSELMGLAFDIARSRQIPLSAAIKAAQMIYKGSARELKNYGIEGKEGMEAVQAARQRERGQAREWARRHPMEVTIGKIRDNWADLVGQLSEGNFDKAMEAARKFGGEIEALIFGRNRTVDIGNGIKVKTRVGGLVQKLGQVGGDLAKGILDGMARVDWGKTLSDTVGSALGAVAEGAKNGTLGNILTVGAALAGAMFAFHVFFNALHTMLGLPGWAAKSLVSVAARAVGLAFSAGMFAFHLFLSAAQTMFGIAAWGGKFIVKVAALAVGKSFALAMFAGHLFITAAAAVLRLIAGSAAVIGAASKLGTAIGIAMRTPMLAALGPIGFAILAGLTLDQFLTAIGWKGDAQAGPKVVPGTNRAPGKKWGFASGTAGAPRGWHWVGERGPELMRFRGGEQVLSNRASRDAMGGGPSVVNLNVAVSAPIAADGARVGADIIRYLDQAFARGHRLRYSI
jgi:hypothetical protein